MRVYIAGSLVFLILSSCRYSEPERVDRQVDTSDGMVSVAYSVGSTHSAPQLEISEVQSGSISGAQMEYLDDVARVDGGLLLGSNTYALALRTPQKVMLFSAGELRRSIGQKGDGPGEFRRLKGPWLSPAGNLVIYDQSLRRLTVYDTTGVLISTTPVEATSTSQPLSIVTAIGLLGESEVVFRTTAGTRKTTGVTTDSIALVGFNKDGEARQIGSQLLGDEQYVGEPDASGYAAIGVSPFAKRALVVACGRNILSAQNDSIRIAVLDVNGRTVRQLSIGAARVEITESILRAEIQRQFGSASNVADSDVELFRKMTLAKSLPVIDRLICARNGEFLIKSFDSPDAARSTYFFVDSTLTILGQFELDRSVRVLDVDSEQLLVVRPGPDELPVVGLLRVERR